MPVPFHNSETPPDSLQFPSALAAATTFLFLPPLSRRQKMSLPSVFTFHLFTACAILDPRCSIMYWYHFVKFTILLSPPALSRMTGCFFTVAFLQKSSYRNSRIGQSLLGWHVLHGGSPLLSPLSSDCDLEYRWDVFRARSEPAK